MAAIKAYEGANRSLHRSEHAALADIISDAGSGTISSLLRTEDPTYQEDLQEALMRAAEIIQKKRKANR
jgi:hypothetical protein